MRVLQVSRDMIPWGMEEKAPRYPRTQDETVTKMLKVVGGGAFHLIRNCKELAVQLMEKKTLKHYF